MGDFHEPILRKRGAFTDIEFVNGYDKFFLLWLEMGKVQNELMETAREMGRCFVRAARLTDIPAVTAIYNREVREGTTNYESREHSVIEREAWFTTLQQKNYPVLVAEKEGRVIGFGALTPFSPIAGYAATVMGSLYIDKPERGTGVWRALAEGMIVAAYERDYHTIVAAVSAGNTASLSLLESIGFSRVGIFREIGNKNGEWFDDIGLQLIL